VTVPKVRGLFNAEIYPTQVEEVLQAKNCNQFSNGKVKNEVVEEEEGSGNMRLRLSATDATNCSAAFWLPDFPNQYGYLISAETKNISGKPLLFWLENLTNRKADLELYLDQRLDATTYHLPATSYLIQPPMAEDGLGYTLHFDNISIGRQKTINELGRVTVNLIPYQFLTSLKLVNKASGLNDIYHLRGVAGGVKLSDLQGVTASHPEINHPNPAVYEIEMKQPIGGNETLVLSQAYHEGWSAYANSKLKTQNSKLWKIFPFLFGEELEHVKVNNWENGWSLPASSYNLTPNSYVIIFWPQWLQWFGFSLLISCLMFVFFKKKSFC